MDIGQDSLYISIMSIIENKNIKKNEILKELDNTLRNFGHWSKDSIYISIMSFIEKEVIKMEY